MSTRSLNICVICVDQMQSACLSVHGHPDVATPHLDALVRSGTSFRRAYCANSVCMPARASLLTGLTPRQHGVVTNGTNLPQEIPTLAGALADAGWRTHAAGKLHLQAWAPGCYVPAGAEPHWSWEDQQRWNDGRIAQVLTPYYGFQTVQRRFSQVR
ncbi:MAG: sulfatase-like hydrolase/transferase [Planctomycetota bacterium]